MAAAPPCIARRVLSPAEEKTPSAGKRTPQAGEGQCEGTTAEMPAAKRSGVAGGREAPPGGEGGEGVAGEGEAYRWREERAAWFGVRRAAQ